jgi:uncharacterized protein YaaW (UPF0174 family)
LTHQEEYKKDPSNCRAYIKDIVDDLQLYGGNTIANMSHGHGIPYRKILRLVCKRLKVKVNADAAVQLWSVHCFQKIADEAFEKMTVEDLGKFVRENAPDSTSIPAKKQQLILAAQAAVRATGFAPYKLAFIVANGVAN